MAHQVVVLHHPLHRVRESDRDSERKTLGNGQHHDGHTGGEGVHQRRPVAVVPVGIALRVRGSLAVEEVDQVHRDDEDHRNDSHEAAQERELLRQTSQLHLQRSVGLSLGLDHGSHATEHTVLPHSHHQDGAGALVALGR